MQDLISTFHIDWKLMIAQIINFAVVFWLLYLIAAKPLSKLMKDRTEEITKGLEDAKTNAELVKNTAKESEETMRKTRNEATAFYEKSKKETEASKVESFAKIDKEIADKIEQGKKVLEAEKIKMLAEVKNEVAALVISATEKVLQEKNK